MVIQIIGYTIVNGHTAKNFMFDKPIDITSKNDLERHRATISCFYEDKYKICFVEKREPILKL